MNIAIVMKGDVWGGVEGYCAELVRQLGARGKQATLIALGGTLHPRVRECADLVAIPTRGVVERARAVHEVFSALLPDIVHVVLSFETQYLLEILTWQVLGWRVVLSEQLVDARAFVGIGVCQRGSKRVARYIKAATYRRAIGIIAPSQASADVLRDVHRLPGRAHVLYNPTDCQDPVGFEGGRSTDGRLRVVTVARLHPQKGLDVLLQACAQLRSKAVDFELDVVGEGPARAQLEQTIGELQLEQHVRLRGEQADVSPYLARADLFVLPSRYEGLPFAILEAMCKGLPVVATSVSGIPEAVMDGRTGFLVPPNDATALSTAIQSCASDLPARIRMGAEGARRVRANFGWDRHVRAVEAVYEGEAFSSGHR